VEIGEAHDVSAAQVAVAWLLGRPAVSSVIVGARTDEQLADNLAAAELKLSDDERARLDAVSAPPLLYPYWHQAKSAPDRLSAADLSLLEPHLPWNPITRCCIRTTCARSAIEDAQLEARGDRHPETAKQMIDR
jgi:hypothetical protein